MSKDTIYRQDFDKFLEDAEKEAVKNRKYVFASALNTIRGNLKIFPSAQQEIIKCRECTHHKDELPGMVYCPIMVGGWVGEDCFCWNAERRTDG